MINSSLYVNQFHQLVDLLSLQNEVRAVGVTGLRSQSFEVSGSDLDIFVYCSQVPNPARRAQVLERMANILPGYKVGCLSGGHWGEADFAYLSSMETWIMYFQVEDAANELISILRGEQLDRIDGGFYPIGRCAMYRDMVPLYDPDHLLASFKDRTADYPQELRQKVLSHHLALLGDCEDFERALNRKDVLFYHYALDLGLDSFLQVLFALNRTFFPSRKRSLQFIDKFEWKPENCRQRLLQAVRTGGSEDNLTASYDIWQCLVRDLIKSVIRTQA